MNETPERALPSEPMRGGHCSTPLGSEDSASPRGRALRDLAGRVAPQIDRNKCEGKADCLRVCPYAVFELGVLAAQQRGELSLLGRLKGWAHGHKQAFVVQPADCHACRLCVAACPEQAIQLVPFRS